jgi:two-component sensor histidine kinase
MTEPASRWLSKSKRQGIGLVQRLIEQVRGSAVIESDHGTAWIISFPVADRAAGWPGGDRSAAA